MQVTQCILTQVTVKNHEVSSSRLICSVTELLVLCMTKRGRGDHMAVSFWLFCLACVTLISTTFTLLSILVQTQTALPRSLLIQTDLSSKAKECLCCPVRLQLVRHPTDLQRASALLQMTVHHISQVNVVTVDAGLVSLE